MTSRLLLDRRGGGLTLALAGLVASCTADPGVLRQKPTVQVPWRTGGEAPVAQGPARWHFTPSAPRGLLGRVPLEGGELYFGRNGERWRVDASTQQIEAAGDLADQDLVAATRSAEGGWLFVGAQGAMYEADSPLGSFRRMFSVPEPVARVAASARGVLAVALRGTLLRSGDSGASFQRASLDAPFVADVQLLEDGSGLLLAFPERLFETRDGGLQWSPLAASPLGAQRLHRSGEGSLLVEGLSGSLLWTRDAPPRPTREAPPAAAFQLPETLGPAPDAAAFHQNMAFWRGDQLSELLPPERRGAPWRLGTGRPGQRMEVVPLPETEGCQRLVADGNARFIVAACTSAQRGASTALVHLLRYGSSMDAPESLRGSLEGALGEARLALGRDDRVLLWGVCRAGSSRNACNGESPLLLPRWPTTLEDLGGEDGGSPWQSVAVPGQSGKPLAAAFAASGRVYLIARQGKTKELGLFVSADGGRSFEGRDLGLGAALEESERRQLGNLRSASLSVADEGIVTAAFEGPTSALVAVTDEDGRALSVSPVPAPSGVHLGLAGRRMLAVSNASAFESLDGGVSWTPIGLVPALRCPEQGTCERQVTCSTGGCVVGGQVGRVGWGGQQEQRPASVPEAGVVLRSSPPPVVCRLGREKWIPLPRGAEMPTTFRADRGKSAWAVTVFEPTSGRVVAVHAPTSSATKLEEHVLFPATRDTGRLAMAVSADQVEGVVATRLTLQPRPGGTPTIQQVEVAWENNFENKLSRGTLPAPKEVSLPGLEPAIGQVSMVELPLQSISNGGVFVRLDGSPRGELFFLDHRGKVERQPAPAPPLTDAQGEVLGLRVEAVRVGQSTVPIGYRDAVVARLGGRGFEAFSLFPPAGGSFSPENQLSFSYLNGVPYLVHIGQIPSAGVSQVSLLPFQASGPLLGARVSGPSQRLFMERGRPCTAQDRSTTARVVAPAERGTRRAVLIEGPDGSPFASMISDGMVLYGTSESPCGSVLDGVPAQEEQRGQGAERALASLGSEPGWYFRAGAGDVVETRPMNCKVAPGTTVPTEVQRALDNLQEEGLNAVRVRRPIRFRK